MTHSADDVHTGRIIEMAGGSGVVETDDGRMIPLVGKGNERMARGRRVQFVVEDFGKGNQADHIELARLWDPEA